MKRSITLHVNGGKHPLTVHPDEPLALALRNRLGLTGLKLGCSLEQCGAGAVLDAAAERFGWTAWPAHGSRDGAGAGTG